MRRACARPTGGGGTRTLWASAVVLILLPFPGPLRARPAPCSAAPIPSAIANARRFFGPHGGSPVRRCRRGTPGSATTGAYLPPGWWDKGRLTGARGRRLCPEGTTRAPAVAGSDGMRCLLRYPPRPSAPRRRGTAWRARDLRRCVPAPGHCRRRRRHANRPGVSRQPVPRRDHAASDSCRHRRAAPADPRDRTGCQRGRPAPPASPVLAAAGSRRMDRRKGAAARHGSPAAAAGERVSPACGRRPSWERRRLSRKLPPASPRSQAPTQAMPSAPAARREGALPGPPARAAALAGAGARESTPIHPPHPCRTMAEPTLRRRRAMPGRSQLQPGAQQRHGCRRILHGRQVAAAR